jgi:hypothetical protein
MLFKLLATPLTGPFRFVEWVGGAIDSAVQAQMNDTDAIKEELTALEKRLDQGELTEDQFEEIELELVMRLQAAKRRMATGERS